MKPVINACHKPSNLWVIASSVRGREWVDLSCEPSLTLDDGKIFGLSEGTERCNKNS